MGCSTSDQAKEIIQVVFKCSLTNTSQLGHINVYAQLYLIKSLTMLSNLPYIYIVSLSKALISPQSTIESTTDSRKPIHHFKLNTSNLVKQNGCAQEHLPPLHDDNIIVFSN